MNFTYEDKKKFVAYVCEVAHKEPNVWEWKAMWNHYCNYKGAPVSVTNEDGKEMWVDTPPDIMKIVGNKYLLRGQEYCYEKKRMVTPDDWARLKEAKIEELKLRGGDYGFLVTEPRRFKEKRTA